MSIKSLLGIEGAKQTDIGLLFIYLVTFVPLIYKLVAPFFIIAGVGQLTAYVNGTLVFIGVVIAWTEIIKYIKPRDLLYYLIVIVYIIFSPYFYPSSQAFVEDNGLVFSTQILPFYFVGLTLDYPKRRKIILLVAKVGIIVQVFWQSLKLMGVVEVNSTAGDGSLGEQMGLAYQLLFPLFFLFLELMTSFKFIDFLFFITGIILIFLMGTRGPIMVLAVFIGGYFLFFHNYKKYPFFKRLFVLLIFAGMYILLKPLLELLIPIASSLGFSPRVFNSILSGQIADANASSDRDIVYSRIWQAIINDPTGFGYGWGGDRLLTFDGLYAHNFELEILCQFGIIGGGFLLLLLAVLLFRSLLSSIFAKTESFWYVVVCGGLMSFQLSDSYILNHLFFVFLGYIVMTNRMLAYNKLHIKKARLFCKTSYF